MEEALKIQLTENKTLIQDFIQKVKLIERALSIQSKTKRLETIYAMESQEDLWKDSQKMAEIQKEKSLLESVVNMHKELTELLDEYAVLEEFALVDGDAESGNEALKLFFQLQEKIDEAEQKALLSEETDSNNAILSINAGAGGTESCDWVSMLLRMVIRWAESKKFKVKTLDYQQGETAGVKSSTLMIEGEYAFGLLKSETGIHRLVRISPFDSGGRRHTSFASIFVSPEVDDNVEIEIEDKDLKIDVYRAGGAGGQSVNTTDSAVRITHLPTGIVVTCQNERSQLQNKLFAMKVLRSRLYEKEMEQRKAKQKEIEGEKKEIGWGSQIRSYVLHPYKMVKDHRTQFEVGTAEKVLDGELDGFIKAYLQWNGQKQSE